MTLLSILHQFSVNLMRALRREKISRAYQGCWVQIAFPAVQAGETVKLSENARGGFWTPASSYEQSPTRQSERGAVQLGGEGGSQASEAYIYIDPRGGVGSGKRYMPSSFARCGDPGRWQLIEA